MTPVWGADEAVCDFVGRLTGCTFKDARGLAVMNAAGEMVAGIVFSDWNPKAGTICLSAAATDSKWAARSVLEELFGYAFRSCGCQAAIARTSPENHPVRRLMKAFGASEHILPHLRGRGASEAILILTSDQWAESKFTRGC